MGPVGHGAIKISLLGGSSRQQRASRFLNPTRAGSREPRLTRGWAEKCWVRNNASGSRERNAAPLMASTLVRLGHLLALFGILHGPTQVSDLLSQRIA
jgi:hypothetical protein